MKTSKLVQSAMFAAIVLLVTGFVKVPSPGNGYMHLGDAVIIAGAFLLGPSAAIPAAVGSALADLLGGYGIFVPATLLVKGALGFTAGWLYRKVGNRAIRAAGITCAELLFVLGGYFLYEWAVFDFAMAVINSAFTFWQCVSGVVIGVIAAEVAARRKRPGFGK
ncbi:ECF transporter S component [Oscillospiraceae bacterium OttesenSCG-928-G22]|nr:ECF transporter S component [Oscillospiraceae bacterium OttesenSCG-928-G22]